MIEERPGTVRVSVGEAILALIVVGGALLRFITLDELPLSPDEAREAMGIFDFWANNGATVGSPAYFVLTALLRPFIGLGDAAVRIVPALFGTATLVLPWLMRRRIGVVGALTASLLMAASPVLTMISRTAGGESIAVFAGVLLFVAWVNYHETKRGDSEAWLMTAAVAIGLGVISAPLFYTFLIALAGTWGLGQIGGDSKHSHRASKAQLQKAGIVIAAVALIVGTMGMVVPAGLGGIANIPVRWLGQMGNWDGWVRGIQTVLYEAPLVIFGVLALAYGLWKGRNDGFLLTIWGMVGLLLILLQGSNVENAAVLIIPAYLLIGLMADRFLRGDGWLSSRVGIIVAMMFGWCMLGLVNVGRYTRVNIPEEFSILDHANLIIVLLTFVLVSLVAFILMRDPWQGVQGLALGLMAACLFYGLGMNWTLTHRTGNHPRETWVETGTDDDIRFVKHTLHTASYQLTRADNEMPILSTVDTPALRWYLRDFVDVEYVEGIPIGTSGVAVIAPEQEPPPEQESPSLDETYMGTRLDEAYTSASFDVKMTAVAENEFNLTEFLKWRFFRENSRPIEKDRVTLWLYIGEE